VSARRHHAFAPVLFLTPAVLVLGLFFAGAFAQVVYFSFTRYTAFDGPHFIGLENYRQLLFTDRFWLCLLNSGMYLLATPLIMALSLSAAMVVEADLRGCRWLRLAMFLPVITPTIVAGVSWRLLLNEDSGLFNRGLASLGVGPVPWLSQHPWTLVSAMLVTLWKGFGFYMMVFLAGLLAVPRELKEAASLDGAGRFQVFRVVTMPAIRPALALVFVISSISALKVFDELYVTVKGAPITQQTVVPLIYQVAFEEGNYGLASAIGITLFVVILGFSVVNLRLSARKG
jgi:putative chitobiose transport system permease protein